VSASEDEIGFVPDAAQPEQARAPSGDIFDQESVPVERSLDDRLREIIRLVELVAILSAALAKEVRSPLARRLLQQVTQDLERYQPELTAGLESVSVIENSKADVISAGGLC
jgi:hypothetical protein